MYSRLFLIFLSFSLFSHCTLPERDVINIQLLDNVRAGVLVYQVYDISESAIGRIEQADEQPLNVQFLVASLIQRACLNDADESLRSCEGDTGPLDWFALSATTLCLTAESIAGRGPVTNNLCLIFPHGMPFIADFEEEPKVVSLTLLTGEKWIESGSIYIEVVEVNLH
ncbi:hypothetical protein PSEUDO9AZ_40177 [Pseudomonas sp. 9AZ]|uniref:hypothetical protein n=1 Tax=Pseudomonas sp. 9AZ TaxID=2653168 RepID=UPI0012F15E0F|nr:hypothetical protein [Pseudomonas sp. 9AZ]VXD00106.1 hypothetical protein PSEUDO9AZ_40177 [Pseudomonas sp. 9AZ]